MDHRYRHIGILLLVAVAVMACEEFELRGFFASYESANERFQQSMAWNMDHPYQEIVAEEDDYSLFVMADSHVGGTTNMDIFVQDALNAKAAGITMVGDLTTGHADDMRKFQRHLPHKDSISSFPIVGNHDLYFDGWTTFHELFGTSTYLFTVKTPSAADLYICLDSGSGTFGSEQLEWLKHTLETERANYRKCVLFTHNNFFRTSTTGTTNPLIEELYVLLDLSIVHDIDMIVTGHDHDRSVAALGNTTHLVIGALKDDFDKAGYLVLSVEEGNLRYEFVDL